MTADLSMHGGEKRPEPVQGGKNVVIGTRTWLGSEWTHVDISAQPRYLRVTARKPRS